MTKAGPEAIAGRTLADAAGGKEVLQNFIEDQPGTLPLKPVPQPIVPGQPVPEPQPQVDLGAPTLAEQVQSPGVSALQHAVESANPVPFTEQRAASNEARVEALQGVQQEGSPADVSAGLRSHFNDLDQKTEAINNQLQQAAQSGANKIGGQGAPEDYGAQFRAAAEDQKAVIRQQRTATYNAIDPNGTLNVVAAPLRDQVTGLRKSIDPLAEQPSGKEASLFNDIQGLPDVIPFKGLQALDSRITAAMSEERRAAGETPVWGRLAQMKSATMDAVNNAVENQVAYERGQVAKGDIAPEQTVEARLRQQWNIPDVGNTARNAVGYREGNFGTPSGTPPAPFGGGRTNVPSGGRLSETAGGQGVSTPPPLTPNFDQATADRLNAAKAIHTDYAQTFKQGSIGQMLRGPFKGQYTMPNASAARQAFSPGPGGYDNLMAFRRATGDNPDAIAAAHDYAAMSLRRAALRQDGTIDPAKFATWQKAHSDAIRALPMGDRVFQDAAHAGAALDQANTTRQQALKDWQQGAVGKVMGLDNPDDVTRTIGGIFGQKDAVAQMGRLADRVRGNTDAEAGLRRAIVDHMNNNFIANSGNVKSDAFQTFIRKNEAVLGAAGFKPEEIGNMKLIAEDLKRAKIAFDQGRMPGQSTTFPDWLRNQQKIAKEGRPTSLLDKMWKSVLAGKDVGEGIGALGGHLGATAGAAVGSIVGGVGGVGSHILGGMHAAGLEKANDLVREALLNRTGDGALAKALLAKASVKPNLGSELTLSQQLRRLSLLIGSQQVRNMPQPTRKAGGRVQKAA